MVDRTKPWSATDPLTSPYPTSLWNGKVASASCDSEPPYPRLAKLASGYNTCLWSAAPMRMGAVAAGMLFGGAAVFANMQDGEYHRREFMDGDWREEGLPASGETGAKI